MSGWLIAAAVILLIAICPVGISVSYGEGGPLARLIAGPVRLQLYPGAKKEKAEKPQKQKNAPAADKKTAVPSEKGGKLTDFLPLVRAALDLLVDFRRKLRVNMLYMKLTLAGDDPCDLAVNYGKAWAALGSLEPQLERFFVIKKKDLQIQCDFEETTTRIEARLDLTITIGRLLCLGLRHGLRGLRELMNIMKLRKGGALQ